MLSRLEAVDNARASRVIIIIYGATQGHHHQGPFIVRLATSDYFEIDRKSMLKKMKIFK